LIDENPKHLIPIILIELKHLTHTTYPELEAQLEKMPLEALKEFYHLLRDMGWELTKARVEARTEKENPK